MKLQSGREVSNELMNNLAESATSMAFGNEDVNEGLDSVAESLEDGNYENCEEMTEAEIEEMIAKIEPLVTGAYNRLKEFYDEIVKGYFTKTDW